MIETIDWSLIQKYADKSGMNPEWIAACIMTESNNNPWAMRYEPNYHYLYSPRVFAANLGISVETEEVCQRSSFGLMQIMGGVCRELHFQGHLPEVFDPDLNLEIGTEKLKKCMQRYGSIHDAIAAYNAGSVVKTLGGFYKNQKHVDRFDSWLRTILG